MHPELLVRKRIWLMTLVLTGLFLLAAARIAVLTTSEAASLTERGIRQWTKAGIVTARRGTITDRKGRTLAISATAYIVTADPRLVSDTEKFLNSIEPVLNINKEAARKRLQDKTKGSIILKRQVSRETVDALRQLRSDAPEDSGLKALSFDEDICRYYPYGALLSQVLGLTTVDSEGQSGLESRYEDVLRGTEGSYLRQVSDTDNLTVLFAHFLHHVRHAVGYFTGNTGIYFVKHNGREFYCSGYHGLKRQHDACYFTTRSDRRHVLQGTVLIGREEERYAVHTFGIGF